MEYCAEADMTDKEYVWREISLLASNNFGPWHNKEEAREKVFLAIQEFLRNYSANLCSDSESIETIVTEMTTE